MYEVISPDCPQQTGLVYRCPLIGVYHTLKTYLTLQKDVVLNPMLSVTWNCTDVNILSYILLLSAVVLVHPSVCPSNCRLYFGLLNSSRELQGLTRYVLDMSLDINRLAAITPHSAKLLDQHTVFQPDITCTCRHCTNHI